MEWLQFLIITVEIGVLWFWQRSESNGDRRELQNIMREDRKEIMQLLRNVENEMKDFHDRLLEIERNRKI